jgi:hypothetical protein
MTVASSCVQGRRLESALLAFVTRFVRISNQTEATCKDAF